VIGALASVLVVHPSVPVHSVADLLAYAKAHPGGINYDFVPGTIGHISTELFARTAGVTFTNIFYKGSGPAMNDLIGGHVSMMFLSLLPVIGKSAAAHCVRLRSPPPRGRACSRMCRRWRSPVCPGFQPPFVMGWWPRPARRAA